MLDRLAAEVLVRTSGAREEEIRSLLAAPLQALRAYLAGRRAFAHGEFAQAGRRYAEAIRLDSTFVQAALGMVATRTFISDSSLEVGDTLAKLSRHRLLPADQVYLSALLMDNPGSDVLALWEQAVKAAPDRMERWYGLGEALFHKGPWLGLPDWRERASAAFRRALELDPDFVPALGHQLDLAATDADRAVVRDLGARYIARDSVGELAEYYRWRIAVALGDSGVRREFRSRLDRQSIPTIERLVNVAQLDGVALEDAVAAAEVLKRNAGLGTETRWGYTKLHEIALNRGRPTEAAALIRQRDEARAPSPADHLSHVVEALFWGADTTLASQIVVSGRTVADAAPAQESAAAPALYDVCAVGLWRAAAGDSDRLPAAIARLRRANRGSDNAATNTPGLCAAVLELELLSARQDPALARRLAAFDSLIGTAPDSPSWIMAASNLTIAKLLEAHGDIRGALRATRRRAYVTDFRESRVLVALSTFLREEGRLAAMAGERDEAIAAYQHYLALRADPEPSVAPEVADVREALTALQASP
jgi:tetratricopeptide (TPR) repeat protein